MNKFDNIKKVKKSASMNDIQNSNLEKKNKIISLPIEWENKIKNNYPSSISSYILSAIFEKMKKDDFI